jgi:hypothetical protein
LLIQYSAVSIPACDAVVAAAKPNVANDGSAAITVAAASPLNECFVYRSSQLEDLASSDANSLICCGTYTKVFEFL